MKTKEDYELERQNLVRFLLTNGVHGDCTEFQAEVLNIINAVEEVRNTLTKITSERKRI